VYLQHLPGIFSAFAHGTEYNRAEHNRQRQLAIYFPRLSTQLAGEMGSGSWGRGRSDSTNNNIGNALHINCRRSIPLTQAFPQQGFSANKTPPTLPRPLAYEMPVRLIKFK